MADLERASAYSNRSEINSISYIKDAVEKSQSRQEDRPLGSERRTKSISNKSRRSINPGSQRSHRSNKSIQDSVNRIREKKRGSVHSREGDVKNVEVKPKLKGGNSIAQDVAKINAMNNSLKSDLMRRTGKSNNTNGNEEYDTFFKNGALIKLPPIQYPVVSVIKTGTSLFVADNNAHSKESNFGYSRNKLGGFYNH